MHATRWAGNWAGIGRALRMHLELHTVLCRIVHVMSQFSGLLLIRCHQQFPHIPMLDPLSGTVFVHHVLPSHAELRTEGPWLVVEPCGLLWSVISHIQGLCEICRRHVHGEMKDSPE